MKNISVLLIVVCVVFITSCSKNTTKIKGVVKNMHVDNVAMLRLGSVSERAKEIRTLDGVIATSFKVEKPQIAVIVINSAIMKYLFLQPNSEINFSVNGKNGDVSFIGDSSVLQSNLNLFMEQIKPIDFFSNMNILGSSWQKVELLIENTEKQVQGVISKTNNTYLKEAMQFYLKFKKSELLARYYNYYNNSKLQKSLKEFLPNTKLVEQSVPKRFSRLVDIDINSPYFWAISSDIEMDLSGLYILKKQLQNPDYENKDLTTLYSDILNDINNSDTYEAFAYMSYFKYGNNDKVWEAYLAHILPHIHQPELLKNIDEMKTKRFEMAQKIKNMSSLPVPTFPLFDISDKEVKLADFNGSFVLLDMWATWCGPCRMEIPHLQEKEELYKQKNIKFVSISFDKKSDKWKRFIEKEGLHGIQLNVGKSAELINDHYAIKGYPTFILLDTEGKVLKYDFPRPSDERFDTMLEEFMN